MEAGRGEVCSVEETGGRREGLAEKMESCFQKPRGSFEMLIPRGDHSSAFGVLSEGIFVHFGLFQSCLLGWDTLALLKYCLKKKVIITNFALRKQKLSHKHLLPLLWAGVRARDLESSSLAKARFLE